MKFDDLIERQLTVNKQINLLSKPDCSSFCFTPATQKVILALSTDQFRKEEERRLIDFTVDAVLSSFYHVNQYYSFDNRAKEELQQVYIHLLQEIKNISAVYINYDALAQQHYLHLQQWLIKNCPEAVLLYPESIPVIEYPVVCAEYTVSTQLQILGINEASLSGPILDIGCGREHHLFTYLQSKGYTIFGLDREAIPHDRIFKKSWLDFSYQPNTWGTIISHLGFSNHFRHHHIKQNGQHEQYAHTYINILHSLKVGGSFYYTPDLPFIEVFLNGEQFRIQRNNVQDTNLKAVQVTKLF